MWGGRSTIDVPTNILFFIDTSKEMAQMGSSGTYARAATDWSGSYTTDAIYYKNNDTYQVVSNTDMAEVYTGYADAYDALYDNGSFIGCISNRGEQCTNKTLAYYTGDYLNWKESVSTPTAWADGTAYEVGDLVYQSGTDSSSQLYKCVTAGTSGASDPFGGDAAATYADGTVIWEPQQSLIKLLEMTFNNSIFPDLVATGKVNIGLMEYNSNDQGGAIVVPVMSHDNADALKTAMTDEILPITQTANAQPLGSALWDAWLYFVGDPTGSSHANSTSNDNAAYSDSPSNTGARIPMSSCWPPGPPRTISE
jgi:hypothetical protein